MVLSTPEQKRASQKVFQKRGVTRPSSVGKSRYTTSITVLPSLGERVTSPELATAVSRSPKMSLLGHASVQLTHHSSDAVSPISWRVGRLRRRATLPGPRIAAGLTRCVADIAVARPVTHPSACHDQVSGSCPNPAE